MISYFFKGCLSQCPATSTQFNLADAVIDGNCNYDSTLLLWRSLRIKSGSVVTGSNITIQVSTFLIIENNASINVDGLGYAAGLGPGAGGKKNLSYSYISDFIE